ncbi:MAG: ATP-binding protein [Thermoplasmatota archaeon]
MKGEDTGRERFDPGEVPDRGEDPCGVVFGNVGSAQFRCAISDRDLKEMDYVEAHHPTDGWVLCQIDSIELKSDLTIEEAVLKLHGIDEDFSWKRIARVNVIGRRNQNGMLIRPLTPILPSSRIFRPREEFIKNILGLTLEREDGAYIGKIFHTDVDVILEPSKLVQNHVSIVAKSGSGKSYTCGILIEELSRLGIPVVILDLHGEYGTLVSPNIDSGEYERMERFGVSPEGLGETVREFTFGANDGSDGRPISLGLDISGFRTEDLLEMMGVKNIGAGTSILYNALNRARDVLGDDYDLNDVLAIVEADHNPMKWNVANGLSHLLSMPMFTIPRTPLTEVVRKGVVSIIEMTDVPLDVQQIGICALLRRLFAARKDGTIPPFMLIVEEAHNFCPQSGPSITSRVMKSIASEGRKFGMGLTIVTQRPAKVDKNVLSQCGTQIIMKVTNPNDLKAVISSVEGLDSRMAYEIQRLPVSVGIVVGGNVMNPILVEMRIRRTRHGGEAVDILHDLKRRN